MARPKSVIEEQAPAAEAKPKKMYRITFLGEGGDVEIGHNYKLNVYQRNKPCLINEDYLQVVKDAVVTTEHQDADGNKKTVRIPQLQYEVEAV